MRIRANRAYVGWSHACGLAQVSWPEAGGVTDDRGFEDFYLAQAPRLLRAMVAVAASRSDAEDVTQEALARVWQRWEKVSRLENPAGYLHRVALNHYFSLGAKTRRSMGGFLHLVGPDEIDGVDERDALRRMLSSLTPRQRAALVVTDYLGYESDAAGKVLGVRPGTVRRLSSQGRARLREVTKEVAR